MKKLILLAFAFLLIFQNAYAQNSDNRYYSKDFKWSIEIPKDYIKVSEEEWTKSQEKGEKALEKTTGQNIINESKTLFVYKADDMHFIEANYQPYDTAIDGDYLENTKQVNNTLYQTFKENIPNAKIDTETSSETINGLLFHTFEIKIHLPNNLTLYAIMYSRLFDKKEFTVNIMYLNPERGEEMINAWKNSTFEK